MQDAKEEVRSRLNIEDVVGEYVQLKRAGRNFKGLSPFSSEKTPSFVVSPEKHIWHDFSSGKGGDIFGFVMEVEGMDFRAALEHLARKAGVELADYDTKQSGEIAKRKKRLLEANELAARYFQQSLLKNQHALEYVFKQRGFSKDIVTEFRIGYAPDGGNVLVQALERRGFTTNELADAGLTNRFGGDLFRGRVVIPLMDPSGQVVGFTGRILSDDPKAPKYLNTPQTLIYDKGRHVFGLSQAKEAIRRGDASVVVEGNLDVVASHMAGVTQTVATAGTALTEPHLKALSRLSQHVKLAFDADKAGLAATERALPIAETVGVRLTIISLPGDAKDPDELIKQDAKLWEKAVKDAEPAIDWILSQYSHREDLSTAAGKRVFTSAALQVIKNIQDPVEQEHYQAKVAEMTRTTLGVIKQKQDESTSTKNEVFKEVKVKPSDQKVDPDSFQDNLIALLLLDPSTRELVRGQPEAIVEGEQRQAVVAFIKNHPAQAIADIPADLQLFDTYVKILLLKAETRYGDWNDQDRYFEAARLLRQVITQHKKQQKDELTNQLREAELAEDHDRSLQLRVQINELIKEISRG